MTILTKNRIIEEGDEYRDNGTWKPVNKKTFGLQVLFTPYKEVRRLSEEPKISPDSKQLRQTSQKITDPVAVPAKAESETKSPAPTHSGAGGSLPTVISRKAHDPRKYHVTDEEAAEVTRAAIADVVSRARKEDPAPRAVVIPYTDLSAIPNWIGRNGTFKATAIRFEVLNSGIVQIRPAGKKGLAKNALIEFPVTEIPQIVDWLLRQQKTP